MNKVLIAFGFTAVVFLSTPAQAGDIFSTFDRALSTVEKTMNKTDSVINRTEKVQKRVADKMPTSKKGLSATDEETLRKAQEIEDRKILEQAEAIRRRSGN